MPFPITAKSFATQTTSTQPTKEEAPKASEQKVEAVKGKALQTEKQDASTTMSIREVSLLQSKPEMVSIAVQTNNEVAPDEAAQLQADFAVAGRVQNEVQSSMKSMSPFKLVILVAAKAFFDFIRSDKTQKIIMDAIVSKKPF